MSRKRPGDSATVGIWTDWGDAGLEVWVTISPAPGEPLSGDPYSRVTLEANRRLVTDTKLPLPVGGMIEGALVALRLEDDGSVSGRIQVSAPTPAQP